MKVLRVVGLMYFMIGLAVIPLLGYAIFGLSGSPGYDFIHGTAFSPSMALAFATLLSLLSLFLGGFFIALGCAIIMNDK